MAGNRPTSPESASIQPQGATYKLLVVSRISANISTSIGMSEAAGEQVQAGCLPDCYSVLQS